MKTAVFYFSFLALLVFEPMISHAQKDTLHQYKNTIRINLTNSLFFGNGNLIFGYERVLGKHQSFSVNVGLASFPKLGSVSFDSVSFKKESTGSGFNVAADYRFYLKKENKHNAPHGVYIGPYATYNQLNRVNKLSITPASGTMIDLELTNKLTIGAVGFQLGYQFLFYHNRIALDLITIGPAYGFYKYQGKLNSNLSVDEQNQIVQILQDILDQKFPGANKVFGEHSWTLSDVKMSSMYSYRFVMHLGYRF